MGDDVEIRVEVLPDVLSKNVELYVVRDIGDRDHIDIAYVTEDGDLRWKQHDRGQYRLPPTVRMSRPVAELVLEALSEQGIETPREATVVGQLEATREHLRDLRELLALGDGSAERSVRIEAPPILPLGAEQVDDG